MIALAARSLIVASMWGLHSEYEGFSPHTGYSTSRDAARSTPVTSADLKIPGDILKGHVTSVTFRSLQLRAVRAA